MEASPKQLAFWLRPAAREREFFQDLIERLAFQLDAPVFEPHLTLFGGVANRDRTLQLFRKFSIPTRCELEIEGVRFSERYTQTLFVRFHLSDKLSELRRALAEALELKPEDNFEPHLSLLYKEMPLQEKEELAKGITIPFQSVSFEGLKGIAHPPVIATRTDVEAWREIS